MATTLFAVMPRFIAEPVPPHIFHSLNRVHDAFFISACVRPQLMWSVHFDPASLIPQTIEPSHDQPQDDVPPLERFEKLQLSFDDLIQRIDQYKVDDHDRYNEGFPFACGEKAAYIQQQFGSVPGDPIMAMTEMGLVKYHQRICSRCSLPFQVNRYGMYRDAEACVHHWGKLKSTPNSGKLYSCCDQPSSAAGCSTSSRHVWTGHQIGFNGPLDRFVKTQPRPVNDESKMVYALDCEMCFTGNGLEATKVSVVGIDGRLVYERFICPTLPIVDYNTRFSGITATDLDPEYSNVATLPEVQRELMEFIYDDTVLIGHALHNDLRALKMIHNTVVDTSILYKYRLFRPGKPALKDLAAAVLNQTIQGSDHGHSSFEDSRTSMELVLKRVEDDLQTKNVQKLKEQRYGLNPNASEFVINKPN